MGLFGKLISFGVGVYAGVYISQNYDVPKVEDPRSLLEKAKAYMEDHRKEK